MKTLMIIVVLCTFSLPYFAQDGKRQQEDTLLLSFIHLKRGDVYVGSILEQNDSVLILDERLMGEISIAHKKISRIENVYQNTGVIITLGESVRYTGTLVGVASKYYILKSEYAGEFNIPRESITDIQILEGEKDVTNNPNATRYFFAPSAIPLEKGKGYYQNAYLLSNSANFGVSSNFSVGGGVVIPLLFYATPKVGFKVRENLYLGAGVIAATTIIPEMMISGGIPYGLVTVGNMEDNFTLGAGYGFIWNQGEYQKTDQPIITVNGMKRISNRIQLVTENWFIPYIRKVEHEFVISYDPMGNPIFSDPTITTSQEIFFAFSLGTRVMLNKNTSMDFAPLYLTGSSTDGVVIPYLDFVYKF